MAHTTICFDFGNTRLKYAVFDGNKQKIATVLDNDQEDTVASVLDKYQPSKSILSSVIKHNESIEALLGSRTQFHKF